MLGWAWSPVFFTLEQYQKFEVKVKTPGHFRLKLVSLNQYWPENEVFLDKKVQNPGFNIHKFIFDTIIRFYDHY